MRRRVEALLVNSLVQVREEVLMFYIGDEQAGRCSLHFQRNVVLVEGSTSCSQDDIEK